MELLDSSGVDLAAISATAATPSSFHNSLYLTWIPPTIPWQSPVLILGALNRDAVNRVAVNRVTALSVLSSCRSSCQGLHTVKSEALTGTFQWR